MIGDALALALQVLDPPSCVDQAIYSSARTLSAAIAHSTGIDASRVFDAMTCVPENMLALLDSPEGWSALAQYVAAELGVQSLKYRPQIH